MLRSQVRRQKESNYYKATITMEGTPSSERDIQVYRACRTGYKHTRRVVHPLVVMVPRHVLVLHRAHTH